MSGAETGRRALIMSVIAQTLGALPVFLIGSLSTLIREDLTMDALGLGLAVAVFYSLSALGSTFLGRLADAIGAWRATSAGLVATVGALAGIALLGSSAGALIGLLALAGIANGWIQPSTNLAVSRHVSGTRQGFAFGVKQSSIPIATMTGGIAVPVIGLTLGWRWAFGLAAVIALLVLVNLPRDEGPASSERKGGGGGLPLGTLMVLAVMSGCGAASANAVAAFLVSSIAASGHSEAAAGIMLAVGSLVSIAVRIGLGLAADTGRLSMLPTVVFLFIGGAVAYACLATGQGWTPIAIGTVLAFGMGWGWSGLSILAIVRASPGAAGAATGITQGGVFAGAVLGPLSFGWIVQHGSYAAAWWSMSAVTLAAAAFAALGHRLLSQKAETVIGSGTV